MNCQLNNVRIVLQDRVVDGSLEIRDGVIKAVGNAVATNAATQDCGGDFLIPGLIDIHTDNLEVHVHPRPTVQWPVMLASALAHDWQLLGSGITTVLDSVAIGDFHSYGKRTEMLDRAINALDHARLTDLLKVEHYLHLRCELCDPNVLSIVERHIDNASVKLVSMMDHTPGQRQWSDAVRFREFYRKKGIRVWTDEEFEADMAKWRKLQMELVPANRATIRRLCDQRGIIMASHDDTTVADVDEAHADGITISEFPTTVAAAKHAHVLGMKNVMGAPNVVLGGSHSGNVSAAHLSDLGLLDMLTSDYVPGSLLHAAFTLVGKGVDVPEAIAMVTKTPADLLNLHDRGRIANGLRADLVRVSLVDGVPVIRNVWVAGRQYM